MSDSTNDKPACPCCGASNTGLDVVDWQCWECGSWRKINGAERRSEICRSGEIAAMRDKITRLMADRKALCEERQKLRDILSVALPAISGTTTAEFGACYSLVESAKLLAAKVAELEAEIKGASQ